MSCSSVWLGLGSDRNRDWIGGRGREEVPAPEVEASGEGEDLVAVVRGGLSIEGRTTGVALAWRVQGSIVTTIWSISYSESNYTVYII